MAFQNVFQNVFQRYELKYMLTADQKRKIMEVMEPYMKQDEFGRSTIRSIYYDTPDSLLIRRSLEKPIYKEKLRVRSYTKATADSTVFIELKKKYESIVYKRRVGVSEADAVGYLNQGRPLEIKNQITEEIDYFLQFYKGLQPAVFLSCEREAFYGKEDHELRITFDENILWRDEDLSLQSEIYGKPILEPGCTLMEIKVAAAMPKWLVDVLSAEKIYQTSVSKYGAAYTQKMSAQRTLLLPAGRYVSALTTQAGKNQKQRRKEVSYVESVI